MSLDYIITRMQPGADNTPDFSAVLPEVRDNVKGLLLKRLKPLMKKGLEQAGIDKIIDNVGL